MMQTKSSAGKQIRNLLAVLTTAVGAAVAAAGGLIYTYNPSGTHTARNVLLSPSLMQTMTFRDVNPETGQAENVTFEGLNFNYFDPEKRAVRHVIVPIKAYEKLYSLLASETSLTKVNEGLKYAFSNPAPASLALNVRSATRSQIFQEVQFEAAGDYYRVQLRQQGGPDSWAYYHHPGIFKEALLLLSDQP